MFEIFTDRQEDKIECCIFAPCPKVGHRFIEPDDYKKIINRKTGETELINKIDYPSIVYSGFNFRFKTCDIDFDFDIEPDYIWNNADIYGILQIIAGCSKDDRRVIFGSLIHDYLLDNKDILFKKLKEKYPGITPQRFRHLTSNIFIYVIISQGMVPWRAKLMGNFVDLFQKYILRKEWNKLDEYMEM